MKTLFSKLLGLYLNLQAYVVPQRAGLNGFLLFCRPFKVPFTSKQLEFLNSGERHVLVLDDFSVQVYRWGSGPRKILFLHGWQSHTYRWKAYIEALPKDQYTVYAIDAPGHGASSGNFLSVPVYSSVIQQLILELGDVDTVVGHSLGGFSLLYAFHQFPLLPVRKMILMAPPGEATDFIDVFKNTLNLSKRTLARIHEQFIQKYEVGPEFFSTAKFAASVNIDGLIIHDEDDREAPYHYASKIQQGWKRSRLITTKGLGHNLKSAAVVSEVVNFIGDRKTDSRTQKLEVLV